MKRSSVKGLMMMILLCSSQLVSAQDSIPPPSDKYVFFPLPVSNKTRHFSLGLTWMILPQSIVEEQVRVPALDVHVLQSVFKGFYLDGRINAQFVQNHASAGLRWAHAITEKVSFSIGDDFAFWFGKRTITSFETKASGWMTYPNISVGYRVDNDLLFTLKGEALINLTSKSTVAGMMVSDRSTKYNGWGATLMLEQPFYSKRSISLGVRAMYTDFFWQTWSSHETVGRPVFYPEVIIGLIL